jgi:hypothetical protein
VLLFGIDRNERVREGERAQGRERYSGREREKERERERGRERERERVRERNRGKNGEMMRECMDIENGEGIACNAVASCNLLASSILAKSMLSNVSTDLSSRPTVDATAMTSTGLEKVCRV